MAPVRDSRRHVHLDREMILETSLEIFHREGLGALTLRRLGSELGVDATAMYRHFRNKAALLTAIIDELFIEIPKPDPTRSWQENLRDLMVAWWQIYRRNESLSAAMAGQPDNEPRLFLLTEWTVSELIRAGVPDNEIGLFQQTIYNHAVGNGLVAAFSPWLTDEKLRREQQRVYAALDPNEFPNAAAVAPMIYPETERAFRFSVDLIIEAIASHAARNQSS